MVIYYGSCGLGVYLYKKGMVLVESYCWELLLKIFLGNVWIFYEEEYG